jgi:3-hydroxyisobutyrate dehydrogenase
MAKIINRTKEHLVNQPRITFIGAGAIGLPMAIRAATAGEITVVDTSDERLSLAREAGLLTASKLVDAPAADVAIIMVATAEQLEGVVLGDAGLAAHMDENAIMIVMSTVGPEAIRSLQSKLAEKSPQLIDAPVTGGVSGAAAGTLTIFVSGATKAMERSHEVLESMGRVVQVGDRLGDGQSFKLVNQLLATSQLVVAAEALAFAEALGLDKRDIFEAVKSGAGSSWMLNTYGPRMLEQEGQDIAATVGIFLKDSTLVSATASKLSFDGHMLSATQTVLERAAHLELINRDASSVIETFRASK